MALTYTPDPKIGMPCPNFSLLAVDGKTYSLDSIDNFKALVIMFICNHCPYVKALEDRLIELGNSVDRNKACILAICSNDPESYPEDSFENLQKRWVEKNYSFPYLHDQTQEVAKSFGAVCTPDFFVFDKNKKLAYRGRLDDSWKEPNKVKKQELKLAIDALVNDQLPEAEQKPAMGCSIKWR